MARPRPEAVPLTAAWDWQLRAACRGADSAFFFCPSGERGPSRRERIRRAKQICAGCDVVQECLRHAMSLREEYGVWGGLSEEERLTALRHR